MPKDVLRPLLALLVATLAAFWDVRGGRISNWLTVPAGLAGFLLAAAGWGPNLRSTLLGCALPLAIFATMFAARAVGGGDVKLAAALGSLGGYGFIVPALLWMALWGVVVALAVLAARRRLGNFAAWLGRGLVALRYPGVMPDLAIPGGGTPMPLAVVMALAVSTTLVTGGLRA